MRIADLDAIDPNQPERWGGKAVGLARMIRAGLPVPRGFAISVEAWEEFVLYNHLRGDARSMRRGTLAGRLHPSFAGQLRQQAATLGERLVVRSSAVEEDGRQRSFAGQHLTRINVRPGDALEDAVRDCWASLYGEAALAYRRGRPRGMGLVVQELVEARVSGVLFTVDPLSGSWSRMVVEAVEGQGEALVSGRAAPDRYVLERPRRRWLTRLSPPREVEADLGQQERKLVPGNDGDLRWAEIEIEGRKLSSSQLLQLAGVGLRVERLAGCPQDLEWSITHTGELRLLQARPITAAGEPVRGGEEVLWTRRFVGERWTGLASPLGWSIASELLHWFIAYPETSRQHLGGAPPTRLLRGVPYFNVSVFRHLAFKLPGRPPPDFMMEFLPPEERDSWTRRFAHPPDFQVYRSILETTLGEQRWRRFRWNPLTNPRAWESFERKLVLPRPGGMAALTRCVELKRQYIKIHITSLLFANIAWQLLRPQLPPDLVEDLLLSGENPTVRTNIALWKWGRGLMSEEDFIEGFGHRCSLSSWEIFTTRWDEEPPRMLAEQLAQGSAPSELAREQAWRAAEAMDKLRNRHPSLLPGLRLTRRYLELREEQRWTFDKIMHRMKACALALDLLPQPEDARWLEFSELRNLAAGRRDLKSALELARRREQQWATYALQPPPPVFLLGDRGVEVRTDGRSLRGLGISPGRATGTVRVLHRPDEAHRLKPGEILVAVGTDPGWTPLFLCAGGVVLELGSMLSHGAVLAREYRLPAVVNVPNATRILKEGQRVTVDGRRGVVWLED